MNPGRVGAEGASPPSDRVTVEFAGEYFHVFPGDTFTMGREGTLTVDDNPFLHRHFLRIARHESLWWLANVGSRLTATVTDGSGHFQAWLAPGARIPLVFHHTAVIFTAGSTTYELAIYADAARFEALGGGGGDGTTTLGNVALTPSQHLLVVALAEPILRREGVGMSEIPTSQVAADRLGWTITKFNRKLDSVCEKLTMGGVRGLHGGAGEYATNRRARLVEHAIAARLVWRGDLALLDRAQESLDDEPAEGSRPEASPVPLDESRGVLK